jgi:hypothetical protein
VYYGREGLNVLGIRAMIEAEVELNRMDRVLSGGPTNAVRRQYELCRAK